MSHAMRSAPSAKAPNHKETAGPTRIPAYRRLRIKADAQLAAQQFQDAAETLRTIQRLQHLSQIK
jgi:hypothetical protein